MKKNAFTLAEVLIVIAIIGIVATVTLPNLNKSTSDAETVAKVKKTVATLQTAYDMAKEKYGEDLSTWIADDTTAADQATRFGTRISQYLSVSKICGLSTNQGCFSSSNVARISVNSSVTSMDKNSNYYKVILNDGTSLAITSSRSVYFDVDGPNKGYNTYGRDIFLAAFSVEGNSSLVSPTTFNNAAFTNSCRSGTAVFCTAWIMNFDNMDYVKCSGLTNAKRTCH